MASQLLVGTQLAAAVTLGELLPEDLLGPTRLRALPAASSASARPLP